jgi:hypothetical protein
VVGNRLYKWIYFSTRARAFGKEPEVAAPPLLMSNRRHPSRGVVFRRWMMCRKCNGELEADVMGAGMVARTAGLVSFEL